MALSVVQGNVQVKTTKYLEKFFILAEVAISETRKSFGDVRHSQDMIPCCFDKCAKEVLRTRKNCGLVDS